MRDQNLSMKRARGWSSKISARVLNVVPFLWFSFTRLITCSNTSDIQSLRTDSRAVDEPSASFSEQLKSNGEESFKKKSWMPLLGRPGQSIGALPNSRVQFKIKKADCSDMEAAGHDAEIQHSTTVTSGLSLKEAISAMEFERPEIEGELNVRRSESVSAVEDACKKFRKCLIEMVVEEKNMKVLMDVEELLYCYQNLTCPVYRDLLSHFFAESCSDIFGPSASSFADGDEDFGR